MRTLSHSALFLVAAVTLLASVVCCSHPSYQFTDDEGREVRIAQTPIRMVSHVPGITETLFALGLDDRIVGVSDHCNYPEEAAGKPKVGGYFTPSIEKILELEPDLVLTDGYPANIGQLDSLEVPYVVLQPEDMDGILRDIELLGNITGTRDKAVEIMSQIRARIDAVAGAVQNALHPQVFYVYDFTEPSAPWTAGPGSFVDALISLAGGDNIAAEGTGPWIQFSLEEIVSRDPEIILVDSVHGTLRISAADLEKTPVWRELTAVKDGRVYMVDGDLVNRTGPRIVDGLEGLAGMIHPDLFKS